MNIARIQLKICLKVGIKNKVLKDQENLEDAGVRMKEKKVSKHMKKEIIIVEVWMEISLETKQKNMKCKV